jgi:hypothetical protein
VSAAVGVIISAALTIREYEMSPAGVLARATRGGESVQAYLAVGAVALAMAVTAAVFLLIVGVAAALRRI